jgi:TatD DNase family protein
MIIDTHCHYNLLPLSEDWLQHWNKAQQHLVASSIVVGTSIKTSKLAIEIAQQEERLFSAVGIHPNYWQKEENITEKIIEEQMSAIAPLAAEDKVLAIGETGLDYFRLDKKASDFETIRNQQITSLKLHLELASKCDLPVILHVRDKELPEEPTADNAYWDTFTEIETHLQNNKLKLIMHCFSGPAAYVSKMVELGAYVGVAGNITYNSSYRLREILRNVPKDRILLETDAPYLPPQEHRGKQCQPWMISETATFLESKEIIDKQTILENTWRLFPQMRYND